jgi:hypothetical protein
MNAKSMPRAPLIIIGGNLAVLDMHPDEHGALDRQNAGSDHVSAGCQRKIAGMTTLTVYINSTMPRVGQASRGNASREDVLRHPVEHEDLHDVRRRIHQRGRRIRTSGRTTGKPEIKLVVADHSTIGLLLGDLGVAQKAISSSQFASSELRTWDVRSRGRTWC